MAIDELVGWPLMSLSTFIIMSIAMVKPIALTVSVH